MNKQPNLTNTPISRKEIGDFFVREFHYKAEADRNRRDLMRRQLHEIIGDKSILIKESKK